MVLLWSGMEVCITYSDCDRWDLDIPKLDDTSTRAFTPHRTAAAITPPTAPTTDHPVLTTAVAGTPPVLELLSSAVGLALIEVGASVVVAEPSVVAVVRPIVAVTSTACSRTSPDWMSWLVARTSPALTAFWWQVMGYEVVREGQVIATVLVGRVSQGMVRAR